MRSSTRAIGSIRSTIPGTAPEGGVVGAFALAELIEQMMVAHGRKAAFDGPAHDREPDERREELGKERNDVDREHGGIVFRDDRRFACALEALERGDFTGAEEALTALLDGEDAAERRAFILNKRGVARIALERREHAAADFDAALDARPAYAPALTNLGNLLLEAGDAPAAIARYEAAIAADPEYAVAHLNLGVAYKRVGRIAEGVRAWRTAQRLKRATAASSWRPARRR